MASDLCVGRVSSEKTEDQRQFTAMVNLVLDNVSDHVTQ
jgi:hypothetical protein